MIQIDAATIGNIILTLVTAISAYLAATQQLRRIREGQAYKVDMTRLEQARIDAESKANTERAKADAARADATRIRNESEGALIRIQSEAAQTTQIGHLLASQQLMVVDAFRQISVDSAAGRAVQDRFAGAMETHSETIKFIGGIVTANHEALKTDLGEVLGEVKEKADTLQSTFKGALDTRFENLARLLNDVAVQIRDWDARLGAHNEKVLKSLDAVLVYINKESQPRDSPAVTQQASLEIYVSSTEPQS